MKVYISVDMEGISGVQHNEHTSEQGYDYGLARELMMGEANAAVAGAVAGGATEVLVSDSHGANGARNLLIGDLHPAADLITGFPRPLGQMSGIMAGFDAAMLVGYHTRSGAFGVLNHTVHGLAVSRLWIDGREMGEIGINALLAGQAGVPIGLVTGDDMTVAEARDLLPEVETATVKWAISRYSSRCLAPEKARETVRDAAQRAVERTGSLKPFEPNHPAEWKIRFKDSGMAESALRVPGVKQVADDAITFEASDPTNGFLTFSIAVDAAAATQR
ncbi:MAG: M55 family metallopeptidase [Thermaerobacterales bacterium]